MSQPYIIGIDIGTGSVKAVAVDFNGAVTRTAQTVYPASPISLSEQNSKQVFDAFKQCLNEIIANTNADVAAVSLSAAMHSVVAVDENGGPLMNALLWSDVRSAGIAQGLRNTEEGKAIYRATGTPLHAMSPLCKIRWLKENEPALFAKAHKLISIKEYVWYRLFGQYEIDHSLASATGLFNVHSLQWEDAALAFAGIFATQLSVPVATSHKRSGLSVSAAAELNLPHDVPFVIGASDGCLANLGSGCLHTSTAAITIGTSAAVRVSSEVPIIDDERMIFNYRLDEKLFVFGGAVNNGGNVVEWLAKKFLPMANGYEEIFRIAEMVPVGSDALLFLPYLHGERAPIWDEESCGVYFGINAKHGHAHFVKAALEGVCFALNDILISLEKGSATIRQIRLSGGGAKPFAQLLADVTGKEVITDESGDASALGAALLSLKSIGVINDYSAVQREEGKITKPTAENVLVYQKLFPVYKTLYPSLKEAMHTLRRLDGE